MEIEQLVKEAKAGDKNALVTLIMTKKEDYYRLAYLYTKNRENSLDALEDMIVILFENVNILKKDASFYPWSKTILVNCCKNILRKNRKLVLIENFKEESYEENFQREEEKSEMEKLLARLNKDQQEAIKLRYFLDLDYQSIAEITKTPLGTVKSRIAKGLKKLKVLLGGVQE